MRSDEEDLIDNDANNGKQVRFDDDEDDADAAADNAIVSDAELEPLLDEEEHDTDDEEMFGSDNNETDDEASKPAKEDAPIPAAAQPHLHFAELAQPLATPKKTVIDLVTRRTCSLQSAAAKCSQHAKVSSDRRERVKQGQKKNKRERVQKV